MLFKHGVKARKRNKLPSEHLGDLLKVRCVQRVLHRPPKHTHTDNLGFISPSKQPTICWKAAPLKKDDRARSTDSRTNVFGRERHYYPKCLLWRTVWGLHVGRFQVSSLGSHLGNVPVQLFRANKSWAPNEQGESHNSTFQWSPGHKNHTQTLVSRLFASLQLINHLSVMS